MCKAGNQSIFRDCMVRFKSMNGGRLPPKEERRRILNEHGGCLSLNHPLTTTPAGSIDNK